MDTNREVIARNIRKFMDVEGVKSKELAKHLNVAPATISGYRQGDRQPDLEKLIKIADFLNVSVSAILGQEEDIETELPGHDRNLVKIPILGTVRAGYNLLADENIVGYTYESRSTVGSGEYYSLIVEGESMINAGIRPGDRILVKKQDWINDGGIAVVLIDDEEATIKRVYRENGGLILQAENHHMKPELYDKERVRILGKVVNYTRSVE